MDSRTKDLITQGDKLYGARSTWMSLCQEIAENFYPYRADFTTKITPGEDMVEHLSTSYPILAHRDMADTFSSMLRARGTQWFMTRTGDEAIDEGVGREWLEWATKRQYTFMYDRKSQFVRATKEGDQDFAAFGQTVIYVDRNRDGNRLLYRNHHLRDCVWAENAEGVIDTIHRKWKPTARDLVFDFGSKVHKSVAEQLGVGKDSYQTFECRHIMLPTSRALDVPKGEERFPFRSYFIDIDNEHIMEDRPSRLFKYVIPRWQTISGSQYAYSPAAIAALPDARMIQQMTYTLLDAGEKAVQPPMIGQADMIKSDIELWGGGVTWVDAEYDERLGEALRPVNLDLKSIPLGIDMARDARMMISEAFFLNKISLPVATREMTAYETSQRIQEYIRQALPLFEPMEAEYNGQLCEMTFETMKYGNFFGAVEDMPRELSNRDVEFKFISPLQENEERKLAQTYLETKALLAEAAALDPSSVHMVDGRQALRDALRGSGTPAAWMREDEEIDRLVANDKQQQEAAQMVADLAAGGAAAEQIGNAANSLNQAELSAV